MNTDGIQVGDVVVLLDDDKDNYVTDFSKYIGLAGEVRNVEEYDSREPAIGVKFALNDYTWFYNPDQLEVIGSVT